jgi:putative Holliday junction resolvase
LRYLGIDYGEKRVGLALSDEEGLLGMPFKTIGNRDLIKNLKKIIKDEGVGAVVLGLPLNLKMQRTGQTERVEEFKKLFEKHIDIPIEFENEFLTSVEAERWGATGEDIDSSSAAIILQSYLDKVKYSKNK